MSLQSRLKSAVVANVERHNVDNASAKRAVVPIDCIRDFLAAHPLSTLTTVESLHSAIVRLESMKAVCEMESTQYSEHRSSTRPHDCVECNEAYVVLDHHEGQYVCSKCGVVQSRRTLNVVPERVMDAGECHAPGHHYRIQGVDKWIVDRYMATNQGNSHQAFDTMVNLNAHVSLNTDQLNDAHRTFMDWVENGYTRETKIVACMLHPLLRTQFATEGLIRTHLSKRQPLPQVKDPTPIPMFACVRCGEMQHDRKSARFHCKRAA